MWQFTKTFFQGPPGLMAAVVLAAALAAQAAPSAPASGPLLPAQSAAPEKEKAPGPQPLPKKPGQSKSMETPPPQMPEKSSRIEERQQAPAAVGTKKIGGQIIRDRETPDGE
ncbi:MAG: hypothetical protein AB1424_18310 [Thermodesulfobacteriota bacterium]